MSGFELGAVEYGAAMEAFEQSRKPERSLEIFDDMVGASSLSFFFVLRVARPMNGCPMRIARDFRNDCMDLMFQRKVSLSIFEQVCLMMAATAIVLFGEYSSPGAFGCVSVAVAGIARIAMSALWRM